VATASSLTVVNAGASMWDVFSEDIAPPSPDKPRQREHALWVAVLEEAVRDAKALAAGHHLDTPRSRCPKTAAARMARDRAAFLAFLSDSAGRVGSLAWVCAHIDRDHGPIARALLAIADGRAVTMSEKLFRRSGQSGQMRVIDAAGERERNNRSSRLRWEREKAGRGEA